MYNVNEVELDAIIALALTDEEGEYDWIEILVAGDELEGYTFPENFILGLCKRAELKYYYTSARGQVQYKDIDEVNYIAFLYTDNGRCKVEGWYIY